MNKPIMNAERGQCIFAIVDNQPLQVKVKSQTHSTYYVNNIYAESQFVVQKRDCFLTEKECSDEIEYRAKLQE